MAFRSKSTNPPAFLKRGLGGVKKTSRVNLLRLTCIFLLSLSLLACEKTIRWKEEVQLPDGRKIIVKQQRDFIEGYGTRKTWLTFSLPEMGGEQTWSEYMQPILIAVTPTHEVFVVGWPSGEKQMNAYRHPRYGYVAFQWDGKGFKRVPFLMVPETLRAEENIVRCFPRKKYLTWEFKMTHGCDEYSEYIVGISRKIDVNKMKAWALKRAQQNNIVPLSE